MADRYEPISRRDVLKLGALGLLGWWLYPPLTFLAAPWPEKTVETLTQGRITTDVLWAYDSPSRKGKAVRLYWRDLIVDILGTAIDDDPAAYNRVWYRLADETYVYSGGVQPVRTLLNDPPTSIPESGQLGEVSVPFTDAHQAADPGSQVVYRLYYESTHWVTDLVTGVDGQPWFRLLDDKYERFYFVPAAHVRLIPPEELAPISPEVPPAEKRIEVHLRAQVVVAYEAGQAVFAARIASGSLRQSSRYATPVGRFWTYYKRATRHMAAGDVASSGFDLPGVPWVLYIKDNGISLHGTYWHNDFGAPRSHGCINLTPAVAKWLYRWSLPTVPFDQPLKVDWYRATRVDIVM